MTEPAGRDELLQRYSEANAQDTARPGAHVRAAVRAHAEVMLAASGQAAAGDAARQPAANQSRWKISMLASIALAGITGLLVLQFDRGTPEEKDIAFGQPRAGTQAIPATPSSPAEAEKSKAVGAPAVPPAQPAALPEKPAAKSAAPQNASKDTAKAAPAPNDASPAAFPASPPFAAPAAVAPAAPPAPAETARTYGRLSDAAEARSANTGAAPTPVPAIQSAPAAASRGPALLQQQGSERAQAPKARAEALQQASAASALQEAARSGRITDIEKLVRDGVPINAADSAGRTPLMNAVISSQSASVQRLLALGANTSLVDNDGLTALGLARKLGLDRIAAMIEARN